MAFFDFSMNPSPVRFIESNGLNDQLHPNMAKDSNDARHMGSNSSSVSWTTRTGRVGSLAVMAASSDEGSLLPGLHS